MRPLPALSSHSMLLPSLQPWQGRWADTEHIDWMDERGERRQEEESRGARGKEGGKKKRAKERNRQGCPSRCSEVRLPSSLPARRVYLRHVVHIIRHRDSNA